MSATLDEVLAHFGVKGMRWGVRSARTSVPVSTSKAEKQWTRKADTFAVRRQVYKASLKQMNDVELPKLNSKSAYKNADLRKDSPLRRAYLKDAETVFNRVLNQQSTKILGPSPSGQLKLQFSQTLNQSRPNAEIVQVVARHADDAMPVNIEWSPMGHIIGCSMPDPMMHGEQVVSDVLAHFGVKGMRWGVRRTRTQLNSASDDFKNAEAARVKAKKSGTKSLSNQELQSLITRMNLEQQYSRVVPSSKGKRILAAGAKFAGDVVLGVGKTQATKIANDQATKVVANLFK